jgi:putative transposase
MGRPPRPTDDGLVYHAINRDAVFTDDEDRRAFLRSLGQTQLRYPFRLYGHCLMSNHFHLLLRPEPGVTISRVLQSLTVAHTWRYHKRHRTVGHVWQGRFKSPVVQDDGHLAIPICRQAERLRPPPGPGRPVDFADWALAVLVLIVIVKRRVTKNAQYRFLREHRAPLVVWLGLPRFPARSTYFDRYRRAGEEIRRESVSDHFQSR